MSHEKEVAFWHGLDLKIGEEMKLGVLPLNIQIEDMGQRVWLGLEPEPVAEGPALLALGVELMKVEGGTEQVKKNGAMVEDDAAVE